MTASARLMAHQREGVEFLLAKGSGLLAFEQGLGKTLVAIEAFRRLRAEGRADTLLVVCPNSLKRTWAVELTRFAPDLDAHIVEGGPRERRRGLAETRAAVVLVNYEAARNEVTAIRALMQRQRCVLVLDESHYVKNYRSLNSVAAQHFAPLARHRWLLTGTPATNTPADLYPQLSIVAGGQPFGSFAAFEAAYGGQDTTAPQRQALAAKITPYLLRRTKEECLDLPDKTFLDLIVELPAWQRRLYDGLRDELAHEVLGMTPEEFAAFIPTAMSRLLRLSQIASNPALVFPDEARTPGKFAELDRLVAELAGAGGRKVILWSYYVRTIEALAERYAAHGATALYGGTAVAERQSLVARFQDDPALRVLVANPAAAGVGFTLTAASFAIYETLTWRYDLYAQSQDRNHRIGQRNPVTYIRLIADGTVEQAIAEALAHKAQMAGELLGDDTEQTLASQLTAEAFLHLLHTGLLPNGAPK